MKNAKKLIVGLMLATGLIGAANAYPILTAPNEINGLIVITDNQGNCNSNDRAYFTTNSENNIVTTGCWNTDDAESIIAADNNGIDTFVWPIRDFTPTPYGHQRYGFSK